MARPATGQVIKPDGRRRSFSLRVRAYDNRHVIRLGRPEDGWTMAMAERELAVVLRDIDLGVWRPPKRDPAPTSDPDPSFHDFASDWFAAKAAEIEAWVDQVAATWNVLPMDARTFRAWARLMHGRSDEVLEDAMIAATALVHGLTVVTRNLREFRLFGVPTLDPFKPAAGSPS